jgi:thiamine biosynthesis protein ThiI
MHCAIVHYHELALKGRNRNFFEQRLVHNLRQALRDLRNMQVKALRGRVRITLPDRTLDEVLRTRLSRVFGVTNFLLTQSVPLNYKQPDLTPLKDAVANVLRGRSFRSFRVSAKRAEKRLPLTSMDVERALGAHIQHITGCGVDLSHPDLTLYVELLTQEAHFAVEKCSGPGGMPVGVSGKVACLISGGIDSPVAAYRMMKRGCIAAFVHFSGRPLVSRASEGKVREIVSLLTGYQYASRLYVIPFGEIQREIITATPEPFRIVLYRRMMVRIAEELGRREDCWALTTGDSLGQVASQTPENLTVVSEAVELPILRPLIGMDKVEITAESQRIGTFDISIEPDQDCCRLFVPAHPSTKTRLDDIRKIERGLDITGLMKQGIDKAELSEFSFPS